MIRSSLTKLLAAVPIILIAMWCASWNEMTVSRGVQTDAGRVFGVVWTRGHVHREEVHVWSPDLSRHEIVPLDVRYNMGIAVNHSGKALAVIGSGGGWGGLQVLDTTTWQKVWRAEDSHNGSFIQPVQFVCDDQFVAATKYEGDVKKRLVRIYRARDGLLVGRLPDVVQRGRDTVLSHGKRIAYMAKSGELVVVDIVDGQVKEIARLKQASKFAFDADGSLHSMGVDTLNVIGLDGTVTTSTRTPESGSNWDHEQPRSDWRLRAQGESLESTNVSGTSYRSNLQTFQTNDILLGLNAMSVAFAIWTVWIVRDSALSHFPGRTVLVLGIITAVVQAMLILQPDSGLPFWCGTICVFTFLGVLCVPAPYRIWVVVASVFILPLLPVCLMALLLRHLRWRMSHLEETRPASSINTARPWKRQFTVRHLLLFTAVVAGLLGLSRLLTNLDAYSFVLAGLIIAFLGGLFCTLLVTLGSFAPVGPRLRYALLIASAYGVALPSVNHTFFTNDFTMQLWAFGSTMLLHYLCVLLTGYKIDRQAFVNK